MAWLTRHWWELRRREAKTDASSASESAENVAVTEQEASLCPICMEFVFDETEEVRAQDARFMKVLANFGCTALALMVTGVRIKRGTLCCPTLQSHSYKYDVSKLSVFFMSP